MTATVTDIAATSGLAVVEFAYAPGAGLWLEIVTARTVPPVELLDELAAAGWTLTASMKFGREVEYFVHGPHGSGPSGSWTPHDRRNFVADARAVLDRFGYTRVPTRRRSLKVAA